MFGRKKKKESSGKPAPHIPVHTMKDDLEGAAPDQMNDPGTSERSQMPLSDSSMGSSSPYSKKPISNGNQHKPTKSPFLSGKRPVPVRPESKPAPPVVKKPVPKPTPIPPTPTPAPIKQTPPPPPIPAEPQAKHPRIQKESVPQPKPIATSTPKPTPPSLEKKSYEPEHKPFPIRKPELSKKAPSATPPLSRPTPPLTTPPLKPDVSSPPSPLSRPAPQPQSSSVKRSYTPPSVGPLAHPSDRLRNLKATAQQQRGMGAPSFRKVASRQNDRAKIKFDDEQPNRARKIFLILFFIVLIFAVIGAGYYFWRTQQTDIDMESLPFGLGELLSQQDGSESSLVPPLGSTNDPLPLENSLEKRSIVIDQETFSQDDVVAELERLSSLLLEERYSSLVEVEVVDTNENPIGIFIFNNLFGLRFSGAVMSGVDERFRLFFYPEKNETRVVLAVSLEQAANTMNAMRASESALATNIEPLYFFTKTNLIGTNSLPFVSNDYKTYPTRYKNFATDGSLSLDYTVVGNYLVIGTSKQSFYGVVDLLESEVSEETPVL